MIDCPRYDICLGLCEACHEENHIEDTNESEDIKKMLLENWFNNPQQEQSL